MYNIHFFTCVHNHCHKNALRTRYYIRIYKFFKFINCILHTSVWTCVGCRLVWLQVYSVSTCASCIVMRSYHLCCLVLPASSLGFSTSLTFYIFLCWKNVCTTVHPLRPCGSRKLSAWCKMLRCCAFCRKAGPRPCGAKSVITGNSCHMYALPSATYVQHPNRCARGQKWEKPCTGFDQLRLCCRLCMFWPVRVSFTLLTSQCLRHAMVPKYAKMVSSFNPFALLPTIRFKLPWLKDGEPFPQNLEHCRSGRP